MNDINILPDTLINQIAAGEVVQRPASIVKELIENALDANATSIEIFLKAGGKQSIKIVDNGHGMNCQNLQLAIQRHATSKISRLEDLSAITTMGFRGEAVPAIASVSRIQISTTAQGDNEGYQLVMHGGNSPQIMPCAPSTGTTFLVEDLFFNTPARRKFMKSDRAELNKIVDVVTRFSLVHPHIAINLYHNDKKVFNLKASSLENRIAKLCGIEQKSLIEIPHTQRGSIAVYGYVSSPEKNYNNRSSIYIAVNGRFIQDPTPLQAIVQASKDFFPGGRFPAAFIYLECLPDWVDVNVHPAKTEVKFQDQKNVFGLIRKSCSEAWQNYKQTDHAPIQNLITTDQNIKNYPIHTPTYTKNNIVHEPPTQFITETPTPLPMSKSLEDIEIDNAPIFQIDNIYIAVAYKGGLLVLDQHAIHEKITFLKLIDNTNKNILTQKLLNPEIIPLTPKQIINFNTYKEILNNAGFDIDLFGENELICHGTPTILKNLNPTKIITEIFESTNPKDNIQNLKKTVIERIACHSSIRGGNKLNDTTMRDLLRQYITLTNASTCPHGRPVAKFFTSEELAKWFHR